MKLLRCLGISLAFLLPGTLLAAPATHASCCDGGDCCPGCPLCNHGG